MAKPEKAQTVKEITERFKEADAALLTEYRGLSVGDIAEVRQALREANAEYKVLKNTLTRLAVREVGLEELVESLTGPTAIAFVKGDAVEAARALDEAAKKFPVLLIKGGVLDGKIVGADQAAALAKLEPREVQLAKIVMMMNSPLQQTINVFSALLRDLGSMLGQVLQQKESEAPPEPEPAAEAPAAEEEAPAEAEEQAAAAPDEPEPAASVEAEIPQDSGEDGEAPAPRASAGGEQDSTAAEARDEAAASDADAEPEAEESSEESEEGKEE